MAASVETNSSADFFVTGGTLLGDAPSYVRRQADTDLLNALRQGQFCYVLTPRQMGKSSLMVRTAERLRAEGYPVALLDLTELGASLTVEQWYYGLLRRLAEQIDLFEPLIAFWRENKEMGPLPRFLTALREVALPALNAGVQVFRYSDVQEKPMSTLADEEQPIAESGHSEPEYLNTRIPEDPRLVIFIDEIDFVRSMPFSTDEFFAGIRQCYNQRAQDPVYQRLTFCLLGVATPSDLIQDVRTTPFNIGTRIELKDFTPEEAAPLAQGLNPPSRPPSLPSLGGVGEMLRLPSPIIGRKGAIESPPSQRGTSVLGKGAGGLGLLRRVLYWTGGHPYLTQRLCQAVAAQAIENRKSKIENRDVDRLAAELFFANRSKETDSNLTFVRRRLLESHEDVAAVLDLYSKVRQGKRVVDDETNPLVSILRLSGAVKEQAGLLKVRNRIYSHVFDPKWIREMMPDAESRRLQKAYRRGLRRALVVSGSLLVSFILFWVLFGMPPWVHPSTRVVLTFPDGLPANPQQLQLTLTPFSLDGSTPNIGKRIRTTPTEVNRQQNQLIYDFDWKPMWRGFRWTWHTYPLQLAWGPNATSQNMIALYSPLPELDHVSISRLSEVSAENIPVTLTKLGVNLLIEPDEKALARGEDINLQIIANGVAQPSRIYVQGQTLSMPADTTTLEVNASTSTLQAHWPTHAVAARKEPYAVPLTFIEYKQIASAAPTKPNLVQPPPVTPPKKDIPPPSSKLPTPPTHTTGVPKSVAKHPAVHATRPAPAVQHVPIGLKLGQVLDWCKAINLAPYADALEKESAKPDALKLNVANPIPAGNGEYQLPMTANQSCWMQAYWVTKNGNAQPQYGNSDMGVQDELSARPIQIKTITTLRFKWDPDHIAIILLACKQPKEIDADAQPAMDLQPMLMKDKDTTGWAIAGIPFPAQSQPNGDSNTGQ